MSRAAADRKPIAILIMLLALTAAVLIGARALFTGSLQQYFLTFACFILALDRLMDVFVLVPQRKVGYKRAADKKMEHQV